MPSWGVSLRVKDIYITIHANVWGTPSPACCSPSRREGS